MARSDFNFKKFDDRVYLLTNYAGRYVFLRDHDFRLFCEGKPAGNTIPFLVDNFFYSKEDNETYIRKYSEAIRSYRDYLGSGTGLHIFVLTSQCNLKCIYCQASTCQSGQMMSFEIAEKSVDLALQSPCRNLAFEFQGGEPLANFETLKHIVLYSEMHRQGKNITYNLVSNLTLLTDEMIEFIKKYNISISTSLDGNERLHNQNRPMAHGNSYQVWREKYQKLKKSLDYGIGAIETTTKFTLNHYQEMVDAYIENGFDSVFVRPLTPLGYAAERWPQIGYSPEEYIEFYRKTLDYIIEKAKQGVSISEGHAVIFLSKILNHKAGNYTELRSPCGAGLGQLAYNYDGRIYTCDEGRMMAEMGDSSFQVGTVESKYEELLNCDVCRSLATASCLESIPQCAECVYAPFCGTCPVLNYYENHNIFQTTPNSYKCNIYMGMLDILFEKINKADPEEMNIFLKWVNTRPPKSDEE